MWFRRLATFSFKFTNKKIKSGKTNRASCIDYKILPNMKGAVWHLTYLNVEMCTDAFNQPLYVHKDLRELQSSKTFKAILKWPLTGVNIFNALLKLIFWRTCIKFGCMIIEMKRNPTFTRFFTFHFILHLMIIFIFLSVL